MTVCCLSQRRYESKPNSADRGAGPEREVVTSSDVEDVPGENWSDSTPNSAAEGDDAEEDTMRTKAEVLGNDR